MKPAVTHNRPAKQDHEVPVARASSLDPSVARDLLVRRITRLAFLIELGSPEIIIRNERRLVGEALYTLVAAERSDPWPGLPEPSADRKSGRNVSRKRPPTWSALQDGTVGSGPPAGLAISTTGACR